MHEQKAVDKLFESHKMINSPVAFLPGLLKEFFSGETDEKTFISRLLPNMRRAKVCLSLMSKNDIAANKIIFRNEFIFADKINFAIVEHNLHGQELKDALKKFIAEYNDADT